MTICAAGINQSANSPHSIIVVCDRKFSWGPISADAIGWKIQTIHRKWRVMFAGPISPLVALMDAVKTAAVNAPGDSLRPFAKLCSRAYRVERRNIIETEILAEYDLDSYAEYQALKSTDRELFDAITKEIKKAEENWNLLFLGFDEADRPHLFVITEYGKIQYCDAEGFAVIGSGSWTAYVALSRFGFDRFLPRGEAMYALLAAKFASEDAEGVGKATAFLVTKATDRPGWTVPGLRPEDIKKLRSEWRQLPRIPEGVVDRLESIVVTEERRGPYRVHNPLKGFLMRTASRKSKKMK